jgi:AcrR family transcriptional regulator
LVARTGINAVTVRTVAEESGWSTGVLSHYYGGRADLLLGALRRAAAVARKHFEESLAGFSGDGVAQLEHILESVLPLDERRLALTRIFLFFYAEAATDEDVRVEIAGYLANWRHDVAKAIGRAQDEGRIDPAQDPAALATAFVALADALSMHAIYDPAVMRQLRKRSPVSTWIAPFVVAAPKPARAAKAKAKATGKAKAKA